MILGIPDMLCLYTASEHNSREMRTMKTIMRNMRWISSHICRYSIVNMRENTRAGMGTAMLDKYEYLVSLGMR